MVRRAVVVGGSSMLGRCLHRRLEACGYAVATAGRRSDDAIALDLDSPAIPDTGGARADVVIHCAASFEPDTPQGMRRNARINAEGAFAVVDLARVLEARQIIYISSLSAVEHPENAYFGSYGLSKRQGGENACLACSRYGMKLGVVSPSQIIDIEGESRRHQPLFWTMVDLAAAGREIVLYGKADPMRNFVYADDVADAVCVLAARDAAERVTCTGPDRLTVGETAALIQRVFARGGGVRRDETRADMKTIWAPDAREHWARLGLSPRPLDAVLCAIAARM